MAAIYSTLGLAQTLATVLGDSGVGAGLFILCCLLVLTAVVTQGLKTRPGGAEIGVAAAYVLVSSGWRAPAAAPLRCGPAVGAP